MENGMILKYASVLYLFSNIIKCNVLVRVYSYLITFNTFVKWYLL